MDVRDYKKEVYVHFINNKKVVKRVVIRHIPRVGDTLRFGEFDFFIVKTIVWIYDEEDSLYTRVNIKIEED